MSTAKINGINIYYESHGTGWHSAVELAEFFLTLQKVVLLEPMDSPHSSCLV